MVSSSLSSAIVRNFRGLGTAGAGDEGWTLRNGRLRQVCRRTTCRVAQALFFFKGAMGGYVTEYSTETAGQLSNVLAGTPEINKGHEYFIQRKTIAFVFQRLDWL